MRITTAAIIAATALLLMGAVYLYLIAQQPNHPVVSSTPPSATTVNAGGDSTFVLHERPQPVSELSFVDGDGREMSLADFRGRTILLNIWATWCVPCREEMPALDRLQAKLGSSDFEVVPLSIDRDGLPKVKAFYEELRLKAIGIYVDASGKAAYRLNTVGIPTTLLIDPDGLETGRLVGPAEWDSPELVNLIQQQLEKTPDEAS
ncbi:TlpA family protein disulfide reductase [Chelativorans intermedius]|uniref:TlpA family protein disulfide reductase n=1 Tax=Chelativorans intermedius TaxID=515947 RepID=A0ABV6DBZ4_9HYPH|nr:TlpA disulfide reductase family protein [Chelativorans intermedius]MCT9000335.1 TlpA family protein disulfide reductase [Chelativorans intermedius]